MKGYCEINNTLEKCDNYHIVPISNLISRTFETHLHMLGREAFPILICWDDPERMQDGGSHSYQCQGNWEHTEDPQKLGYVRK